MAYSWPGNIRELENCIEHTLAMSRRPEISPEDLPVDVARPEVACIEISPHDNEPAPSAVENDAMNVPVPQAMRNMFDKGVLPWQAKEIDDIINALTINEGKKGKAAETLGISRHQLWRKMMKYQIKI